MTRLYWNKIIDKITLDNDNKKKLDFEITFVSEIISDEKIFISNKKLKIMFMNLFYKIDNAFFKKCYCDTISLWFTRDLLSIQIINKFKKNEIEIRNFELFIDNKKITDQNFLSNISNSNDKKFINLYIVTQFLFDLKNGMIDKNYGNFNHSFFI